MFLGEDWCGVFGSVKFLGYDIVGVSLGWCCKLGLYFVFEEWFGCVIVLVYLFFDNVLFMC